MIKCTRLVRLRASAVLKKKKEKKNYKNMILLIYSLDKWFFRRMIYTIKN